MFVPLASQRYFMINYSVPSSEGEFVGIINVTSNDTGSSPRNGTVVVNMTVTVMGVDLLSPTESSPKTGMNASNTLEVHVNVTYNGTTVSSNTTINITVGTGDCTDDNYTYISNYWNITCSLPSLDDGLSYNVTAIVTHTTYGTRSDTENNAVTYFDSSKPYFSVTQNNINIGNYINLTVNITDNIAVANTSAEVTYPNGSKTNLSLSRANALYGNRSLNLTNAGEYLVNYSANDTIGNFNSTSDWFEVIDKYSHIFRFVDSSLTGINNMNVSLFRPNSTYLLSNTTNSSGSAIITVNKRFYDMHVRISSDKIIIRNVNFSNLTQSNITFSLYRVDGEDLTETITNYKPFIGFGSNTTGATNNGINAVFNYTGYNYDNANELEVIKCSMWNFTAKKCTGSWSALDSTRDIDNKTVAGNSTGFSGYFLAENKCGNGVCETSYAETSSTCSTDCVTAQGSSSSSSSGGGGGGGGVSSSILEKIKELITSFINIGGMKVETTSIYKELFPGEVATVRIKILNTLSVPNTVELVSDGETTDFVFFETHRITFKANEQRDILVKIVVPKDAQPGNFEGDIVVKSGKEEGTIPTTIRVLTPEGKLLDLKIQPLQSRVTPGDTLRLQTDVLNLGKTKRVDIQFDLQLLNPDTGEIVTRQEESFAVETSLSVIKELPIPEHVSTGKYMVKATAYYLNVEQPMQASSIAYISVDYPLFLRKIFGIPFWVYFISVIVIGLAVGTVFYFRWLEFRKKRFKVKVDSAKLPQQGPHAAFIGKVAETDIRTFADLNKLQTHMLIAGATGSGKTVAAQSIIEEALLHGKSVIVFDPTAQWTGFLRKGEDKTMLKRFKYFEMNPKNARAFSGTIKTIRDPYEVIEIVKYMNRPGEITIINISNLTPQQIDIAVAATIEQVFKINLEESTDLKTLLVYDEVHRLLPKFGGSGRGFIQLERGAREFRKWGIGLILISQVLSDFVGEVKANIGTEIQMRTRYEGDLERVNMKFGEDVLKSVVKEPIGTGMFVNAEYNNGKPYFISFRPLLHSTRRLTNDELKKYEGYSLEIEDIEYQVEQLIKYKVDVFDLELELKLTRAKVTDGQFQMADMYLEPLKQKLKETWVHIQKKPEHIVRKKISSQEVLEGISAGKKERKKFLQKNPEKEISLKEEMNKLKKGLDEKKSQGKNIFILETKFDDLKNRIGKNDKVNPDNAKGILSEIEQFKKDIEKL